MAGCACPDCSATRSSVVESRAEDGTQRRRRVCLVCGARWSTLEVWDDRLHLLEDAVARAAQTEARPEPRRRPGPRRGSSGR